MDKMREKHVAEMKRLKTAIAKAKSEYLKRDYSKALKRMERELKEYDRCKGVDTEWQKQGAILR